MDPHELADPAAISVEETPVEKAPAEEKAAPEFPGEGAPLEQAAVAEVPLEEAPIAEATVEEAPVAEESVEQASVEEASVEEASVEEVPVEEPLVDDTAGDGPVVTEPEIGHDIDDEVVESDDTTDVFVPLVHEHVEVDSSVDEGAGPRDDVASASGAEAIRIRGLVKTFGDHTAVNGIDLTVPAGSFYGIVGPNGAGKTTTLSIVAGLLRADRGDVVICGVDQKSKPLAAKRMMGVLPDRLRTFDRLTGRQLLHYYGLLRGLASDVIEKRVGDLARAFDLGDALNRVVSDYSAGMTKKIMLAGAMIHSPRVLVLDEPFEAVDPVSSAVILDILRAYVAHGGTVILSSHGMDLVERVCSRVAIIVGGDVLAEGTIDEVRAGQTLEARFVELSGGIGEVEGLEWLHTFSD
nr:ATP-binding cassette domain-containing protein [Microbacterium sp.]